MKYFLDTEFIEGTQEKRVLGFKVKTKPTIDLISIGIKAEDGREYYAISKDFNLKEAWNRFEWKETNPALKYMGIFEQKDYWIRDNVLKPIFDEWNKYSYHSFTYRNMKYCINCIGKTNKQIAEEIKEFCLEVPRIQKYGDPEFYAYYADYDWVAFCWLFGKMIDLPNRFPKYCIDLKQTLETKKEELKQTITDFKTYPKQTNEHNALSDALFCRELYYFLNTL